MAASARAPSGGQGQCARFPASIPHHYGNSGTSAGRIHHGSGHPRRPKAYSPAGVYGVAPVNRSRAAIADPRAPAMSGRVPGRSPRPSPARRAAGIFLTPVRNQSRKCGAASTTPPPRNTLRIDEVRGHAEQPAERHGLLPEVGERQRVAVLAVATDQLGGLAEGRSSAGVRTWPASRAAGCSGSRSARRSSPRRPTGRSCSGRG